MTTTMTEKRMPGSSRVLHYRMFIGGEWVDSEERYELVNPATEAVVATAAKGNTGHVDAAVAAAKASFERGEWRNTAPARRADVLDAVVTAMTDRMDELTELGTIENGAPLRLSQALSVGFPLMHIRYFAELLRKYDWERPGPVTGQVLHTGFVRREPIGVCAGIVPWNFPWVLTVWKAIPAIAAGNSVVIKADEKTPRGAVELVTLLRDAGLPDGVYNVVTGDGDTVGAHLVAHPDVRKVSFTGSTATGRKVMHAASDTIKRVTLELGGKGPNIVLDDADLDIAVDGSIYAFLMHAGQACESGTRLLLPDSVHDEFVARLISRIQTLKIGNPLDPATDVGPVMSATQRDRILGYIERGKQEGAMSMAK